MDMREQIRRLDQQARKVADNVAEVDSRIAQVEHNTARIAVLEQQMAAVLAALPKIKGL